MIFLALAIICGSLFAVVFKICQIRNINTNQVILFNYVTAILANCIPIIVSIGKGESQWSDYSLPTISYPLAILQGVLFTSGFIIMDHSTWRSGVALTTAAARTSLILSVTLSWMFLSQPAPSWLPVILVLISILLIIIPNKQQSHDSSLLRSSSDAVRKRKAALCLLGVFLFYGLSDFALKLSQQSTTLGSGAEQLAEYRLTSLTAIIFIMAGLVAFIICLVTKSFRQAPLNWKSILGGVILGTINLACTSCTVRGLSLLPTGLYYPLYNIGIVIIATIIGIVFFKEKIKWLQILGLLIAVAAISLFLNA